MADCCGSLAVDASERCWFAFCAFVCSALSAHALKISAANSPIVRGLKFNTAVLEQRV
jgi:hypothetical protein